MDFEGFAVFQVRACHLECMLCYGDGAGYALLGTAQTGSITCTGWGKAGLSA